MQINIAIFFVALVAHAISSANACSDCYGPTDFVRHERLVRRMQPTASNASYGPSRPLEWGQINFLQTTDTHGWLEGHIKEQNYGADWGDFVSFTRHMKRKAQRLGVDLLLIDTGISIPLLLQNISDMNSR
jgi:2',3'-cyclic-nucleotide 2'-phosphodiesterase (5'-nucleotidase family)